MELKIFSETEQKFPKQVLQRAFSACMQELQTISEYQSLVENKKLSINCVLTDNEKIRPLNFQWRGKDKATDVLSFPYEEVDAGIFGEIFLSLEQAQIQADFLGHSLEKEVEVLLTHGILHLFGYDHEQENDFLEMNLLEKSIEKRLGEEKSTE